MNHTRTAAIVGGDVRQVFLGELLAADGMRVGTGGLERHVCELPIFCDMAALFAEADVVLLPMPVTRDEMYLHAPLANAPRSNHQHRKVMDGHRQLFHCNLNRALCRRNGVEQRQFFLF